MINIPFISSRLFKVFKNSKYIYLKSNPNNKIVIKPILVFERNCSILSEMVGYVFKIYNGIYFFNLTIVQDMIGFKFGDFIFTKKMARLIHTNNRLQMKKRKKSHVGKGIKKKKIKTKKMIGKKRKK